MAGGAGGGAGGGGVGGGGAPRFLRCARIPRSTSALAATIHFVIFGLVVTMVYGRSITAVVIGVVGIIASLEALFHLARAEYWVLPLYSGYLIAQTAVSVGVGASVLAGVGLSCAGSHNPATCNDSQVVYGLIMTLGSSSVGIFAAVNAIVVYYAMRGEAARGAAGGGGGGVGGVGGGKLQPLAI